ncbi:MAG: methionyl-tRNA formyltransferase [Alphaproteobacteria bacterium]|nr:methionyl-tRNA formyltransferase [Alphaproteobacteria bacterium]
MVLRLAFMGTPDFAVPTLAELLAQGHDIAAVYSQPPRPKGRGMETEPGPVHKFASAQGLEVRTPLSLKGEDEQAAFAALNLDAAVVVAYGLLLPQPILDAPRLGCFNLHGSLLPRWRGAAPIQRAVMAGDAETGVMVMKMEAGLDTGPVLMAERMAIGRKIAGELTEQLSRLGADLMLRALSAMERGNVVAHPQAEAGVTYAKKISKDEARIDWTKSAAEIDCLIRGLSPWPGAWTEVKGERLKLLYAEPVSGKGPPGEIISDNLLVACGEGALRLKRVQRAGSKVMAADELLKGFSLSPGTVLG